MPEARENVSLLSFSFWGPYADRDDFFLFFLPTDIQIRSRRLAQSLVLFRAEFSQEVVSSSFHKMLRKYAWLLCWSALILAEEVFAEAPEELPFFRRVKEYRGRSWWSQDPQEEPYRRVSPGYSHGHPFLQYESSSGHSSYSSSSPEHWRPSFVDSNATGVSYHGYSRTHLSQAASARPSYQSTKQGSYSTYQFQQIPSAAGSHGAVRKIPAYYLKDQVHNLDVLGKSKYKKNTLNQSLVGHQKTAYPRVHKPYVKHKYPTRKTVHPLYRRYYQSPYQRYVIPSEDMLHHKVKPFNEGHRETSTASPVTTSDGRQTTERMDDAYPEESSASEDYSVYGDARQKNNGNYYDSYEEVEKNPSELEENSSDETATRGYYGDRIYMGSQVPLDTSEKAAVKNKYFLVRRTSDDEDIETIFE